jgi:hypothetical protein
MSITVERIGSFIRIDHAWNADGLHGHTDLHLREREAITLLNRLQKTLKKPARETE